MEVDLDEILVDFGLEHHLKSKSGFDVNGGYDNVTLLRIIRKWIKTSVIQREEDLKQFNLINGRLNDFNNQMKNFNSKLSHLEVKFKFHNSLYSKERSDLNKKVSKLETKIIFLSNLAKQTRIKDSKLKSVISQLTLLFQTQKAQLEYNNSNSVSLKHLIESRLKQIPLIGFIYSGLFELIPSIINSYLFRPILILLIKYLKIEQVIREDAYNDTQRNPLGLDFNDPKFNLKINSNLKYDKRRAKYLFNVFNFILCELLLERLILPLIERSSRPLTGIISKWVLGISRNLSSSNKNINLDKNPGFISIIRATSNSVGDFLVLFSRGFVNHFELKSKPSITSIDNDKDKQLIYKSQSQNLLIYILKFSIYKSIFTIKTLFNIGSSIMISLFKTISFFNTQNEYELKTQNIEKSILFPSGYAGTEKLISFRTISIFNILLNSLVNKFIISSNNDQIKPTLGSIFQLVIKMKLINKGMNTIYDCLKDAVVQNDVFHSKKLNTNNNNQTEGHRENVINDQIDVNKEIVINDQIDVNNENVINDQIDVNKEIVLNDQIDVNNENVINDQIDVNKDKILDSNKFNDDKIILNNVNSNKGDMKA